MKNILENLFESLDINENNGLMHGNSDTSLGNFQQLFYNQAKEKIGVDAVYFLRDTDGIAKIPLIYFSMMETYNPNMAARLHQLSWNMGEAPLLFVVTPTELKIFNNYKTPQNVDGSLNPNAGLIDTISLITDLETQRQKLQPYNRSLLESGEYWRRCKERFDVGTRIDTTLMNNLKAMRRKLINMIKLRIPEDSWGSVNYVSIVHSLLSRSILIKYLEERKDANGQSIFPDNFYNQFSTSNTAYKSYTDVLGDKEATYKLFAVLEKKFNGDMFPLVENEYETVTDLDLQELKAFLLGDSDLENQQLVLWPLYDFNVIPIQIISSIYELFFHLADNEDDDKGTYYTPLHLVDTLLDEVYSWDGKYEPIKIIDPSCGSGIFLVEIYRRMVCRWMNTHYTSNINAAQLIKLLKDNIYGVDINEEAMSVETTVYGKENFKPKSRYYLKDNDDLEILEQYNSEIRGFRNYYSLANNSSIVSSFGYIMQYSMFKTFATKYRTSVRKITQKLRIGKGFGIRYKDKKGNTKTRLFYNEGFSRKKLKYSQNVDIIPKTIMYTAKTSLKQRLEAGKCEYCGNENEMIEIHHVRKLKDLKGKSRLETFMIARNRKTIALCRQCHSDLHLGRLN